MPCNYTITNKGAQEVHLKSSGNDKLRVTVMLGATADGRKLPPYVIFKRKKIPQSKKEEEKFPDGVVVRAQEKGWMDESLMLDWLKVVWGNRPGALLNLPSILVLDAFRGHLTDKVKGQLRKMNTELVVTPGGMTGVLQPMDVSINKPVKAYLRKEYDGWIERDDLEKTWKGKIKRASPVTVAKWVKRAWDNVSEDIVSKSFKKCCISNALDGSEDDIIWQKSDSEDSDYEDEKDSSVDEPESGEESSDKDESSEDEE